MVRGFVVIHRRGQQPFQSPPKPWVPWQTCIRKMLFGYQSEGGDLPLPGVHAQDQVFHNVGAYEFALEVVCGLHSPVLGETEVQGQFKLLLDHLSTSLHPEERGLHTVLQNLDRDARKVRKTHLHGIGGASYGSWVRKRARDQEQVNIIGAGHLTQEILPWLKSSSVRIYSRQPEKARELEQISPSFKVEQWGLKAAQLKGVVVIAAPLKAEDVTQWLKGADDQVQLIIDLRGESSLDPLLWSRGVDDLSTVFSSLSQARKESEDKAFHARELIRNLARETLVQMQVRPFGWEDVCF